MNLYLLIQCIAVGVILYLIFRNVIIGRIKEEPPIQVMDYLYRPGYLFIDVREKDEFFSAHIPKSKNVPMSELKYVFKRIETDKRLVVVSKSGEKSKNAVSFLKDNGYDNLISLKGGLVAWQKSDYPLECG